MAAILSRDAERYRIAMAGEAHRRGLKIRECWVVVEPAGGGVCANYRIRERRAEPRRMTRDQIVHVDDITRTSMTDTFANVQYRRIYIARHDSVFDAWFVIGTRVTGGPITLGAVSVIEEAEAIAAYYDVAVSISDEVRTQMRVHGRVQAAWRAA